MGNKKWRQQDSNLRPFTRQANALPSGQTALARGVIGSLFLLAAGFLMKRKLSYKAIRQNIILLLASGCAIGFNWIFLFEAYKYTTISNATLSYYFAPVFVIFLSPLILKERLTKVKISCSLCAVAGMFLIVGMDTSGAGSNPMLGIGYGLLAAGLYASVVLMNKFLKNLSGMESTLVQLSAASVVLVPYVYLTEDSFFPRFTLNGVIMTLIVGLIHTGFAYLLYFSSLQKVSGQTAAVFSYIDPVSAIMLSSIFLNEKMGFPQMMGGILILGATYVSEIFGKPKTVEEHTGG